MISMDKGLISMTWRWMWKLINKYFFPVFVFKQIVSLVALVDSSKTIIELEIVKTNTQHI